MFDGAMSVTDPETAASYELEWTAVHRKLRELAIERVRLDAEEGTYLLEAEDLHVYRRVGYRSMTEYMVGELGYGRHAANERLRVTRELLALPRLAAAYGEGELCFSKVRELTRVVTPATEEAFLVEARGKDSHQVARLVSGLKRGDLPDAVSDPALVTRRVVFELHAEALALLSCRTRGLKAKLGREPTHDELIMALCTLESTEEGPPGSEPAEELSTSSTGDRVAAPPPRTQQTVMICKHCDRSELVVEGESLAIDRATAERLSCDVEIIGDAGSDERTRVSSKIPAALRRKVFARDRFRCVVPGCTARRHLDVHHLEHREHGGTHTMSNLCVLCFFHHKQHHDGDLEISGTAPHRIAFQWRRDEDTTSPAGTDAID